ncbi:MAG TPA: M20/M25/M40 family metallo-hydrolase [Pyrinomonadaceae bacterium]|nr:M20/M25/M40 family metallo-hydrolase [Pyrinomonadaceae bacterium]
MRKNLLGILLISAFLLQSAFAQTAVKLTPKEKQMADAITANQLKDYLYFVASDEMEGRDTPSRGLDTTAKFIGMMLSRWGFKPAGDNGTFYQKIALKSESFDPANTVLKVGGTNYQLNTDFFRMGGNSMASDAGMVFGGHGWMVKSKNVDELGGVDVKGKVVVLYNDGFPSQRNLTQLPAGVTQADLTGTKGTDWADPITNATQKGAVGILLVASPQLQGMWSQLNGFLGRGSMYPEKLRAGGNATPNPLPIMLVSDAIGNAIFAGESGNKTSATAFAINKTATVGTVTRSETKYTQNVVAIWEGSDPKLKNEMVAIGAHYDHVGMNPNSRTDDKIWNGADDDGSGTVAVLSIAEALAKSNVRPKRSILFVWHCGEEKGLWGSEYFNKFPTVDIKNVITQLNIDMIGRSRKTGDTNEKNKELSGENDVYVIGSEMMSSTLGAITKGTNNSYLKLGYDYRYDDPNDKNRFFFRSDHFNYAQNGIPIVFWFDGVHEDYHQPGDQPEKIDYAKMEKITRTIFLTLWELTDLKERPKVDKQLPKELTGER